MCLTTVPDTNLMTMAHSTPPSSTSSVLPPFLRLPVELHLKINSYLKADASHAAKKSLVNLRTTNRYFYATLPPTHSTLLRLEYESSGREGYACRHCLRLRPASKFIATALKGKTGLDGIHRRKRFCADCGFDVPNLRAGKYEGYSPGLRAHVDGIPWTYCMRCRQVKKGEEAGPGQCNMKARCTLCYEVYGCGCGWKCANDGSIKRETAKLLERLH